MITSAADAVALSLKPRKVLTKEEKIEEEYQKILPLCLEHIEKAAEIGDRKVKWGLTCDDESYEREEYFVALGAEDKLMNKLKEMKFSLTSVNCCLTISW